MRKAEKRGQVLYVILLIFKCKAANDFVCNYEVHTQSM